MIRIYPYMTGSKSVKALKESLEGAKIIKLKNSSYHPKHGHVVVNWGNSRRPSWLQDDELILNQPENVAIAGNKLETLEVLLDAGVPTVPFTTDQEEAQQWLADGQKVYARHTLTGHSGEGIEVIEDTKVLDRGQLLRIANELDTIGYPHFAERLEDEVIFNEENVEELPDAPLYTRGVANAGEYRVHVFGDDVILYQKKSRRVDDNGDVITAEGEEADVRNLASNWVYRTGNLRRLERIEELAVRTISELGLDFGAVDIIKDNDGNVFVLEVNTAPGLGNTDTLEAYTEALSQIEA